MFERYERPHFHVAYVGHCCEYLASRNVFASATLATRHDAGERRADVSAADLIVDLTQSYSGELGIRDREIVIRLRLLQLELGHEARSGQLPLAPELAFELPDVDLGPFQQHLLLGALQHEGLAIDACNGLASLHHGARFGHHDELSGDAGGQLHVVAAVYRAGHRNRRRNLGLRDVRYLHDRRGRLLCDSGAGKEDGRSGD